MSTIREVAALAGVSPATVSRVINHDTTYKMTDETKEKIWRAVAELNYNSPSSSGQQFKTERNIARTGTSYRFGCVLNVQGGKYTDPYFLSVLSGFEEAMLEAGHEIAFVHTNEEFSNKSIMFNAFEEPPTGLIIMNTLTDDIFAYAKKKTPHIVGVDTKHTSIDNIAYDHFTAAYLAVKHLHEQGYKRIGFVGGFAEDSPSCRRFKGYFATLNELGLEFNPKWVLPSNWSEDYCIEQIKEAYRKGNLPDAYFVASDLMAIAVLRAFYDLGVSVPGECAVMGLSNIEISRYSNPPLSTIAIPIREMGRVAAKVLLDRIAGDTTPTKVVSLGLEVLKRNST